jgi:hypothetical protein
MVKPESLPNFWDEVAELFGFLFAQEVAQSPITPRDTNRMASSFPATFKATKSSDGVKISFSVPYYTEFVLKGTKNMQARPFINQILFQKGEKLLKQAVRIIDKRWEGK